MEANTFPGSESRRSLPRNRRLGTPTEAPTQTDIQTDIWKEGFTVGLFFGVAIMGLMVAYLV